MNKKNVDNAQQQLENNYVQNPNMFFEPIKQKMQYYSENQNPSENIITVLTNIKNKIDVKVPINVTELELLGSVAYFIGIDYVNQPYPTKEVCEKVAARIGEFKFPQDFSKLFVYCIINITEDLLLDAKDEMKLKFTEKIKVKTEDKLNYGNMRIAVKRLVDNSIIPLNMAVATVDLLNTVNYTYEDILKINSLVNRQCKFNGVKAIKNMMKLYGDQYWTNLLTKASQLFDAQKFAIIYLDGILSVKESIGKFGPEILISVLNNDVNSVTEFESFEEKFNNKIAEQIQDDPSETQQTEDTSKVPYVRIPDSEISAIQQDAPDVFMNEVICDLFGYYISTPEEVLEGMEKIIAQTDYAQHIYHYMKSNLEKIRGFEADENFGIINVVAIIKVLTESLDKVKSDYKRSVELICKEIPADILSKLVAYVKECIGDLILVTDEQKQNLVSQYMENGITTYQHLEQILTLIETCDIPGSCAISYSVLNKFLVDNSDINAVFTEAQDMEQIQMKLQFNQLFVDFFTALDEAPEKVFASSDCDNIQESAPGIVE